MERLIGGLQNEVWILRVVDGGAQLLHRPMRYAHELLTEGKHHGRADLVEALLQVFPKDVAVDDDAQPGLRDAEGGGALTLRPVGVGDQPVGDGLVAEADVLQLDGGHVTRAWGWLGQG